MTVSVTVEEIDALAENLSLPDQQRLIQQVQARIERAERTVQVERMIQLLRENALPACPVDSAETLRQIREERMAQLCQNDA